MSGERLVDLAERHLFSSQEMLEGKRLPVAEGKALVMGSDGWKDETLLALRVVALASDHGEVMALLPVLDRLASEGELRAVLLHNSDEQGNTEVLQGLLARHEELHVVTAGPTFSHPRLHGMPIGVQNAKWDEHAIAAAAEATRLPFTGRRRVRCCPALSVDTNAGRAELVRRATALEYSMLGRTEPRDYLAALGSCSYVLCPNGNQPDTHRLWQAQYAGSIPVMEGSGPQSRPIPPSSPAFFANLLRETAPGFRAKAFDGDPPGDEDSRPEDDPRTRVPWLRMGWFENLVDAFLDGNKAPWTVALSCNESTPVVASRTSSEVRVTTPCQHGALRQGLEALEAFAVEKGVQEVMWKLSDAGNAVDARVLRPRARAWGTKATLATTGWGEETKAASDTIEVALVIVHEHSGFAAVRQALGPDGFSLRAIVGAPPGDLAWFDLDTPGPGWVVSEKA